MMPSGFSQMSGKKSGFLGLNVTDWVGQFPPQKVESWLHLKVEKGVPTPLKAAIPGRSRGFSKLPPIDTIDRIIYSTGVLNRQV